MFLEYTPEQQALRKELREYVAQLLTPEGPVDIEYVIAGDQSRATIKGRLATLPQGSIVLQRVGVSLASP